jgi:two-component system sensor histidine kinase BaeS
VALALATAGLMAVGLWALATIVGLASAPAPAVFGGLLALVLVAFVLAVAVRTFRRVTVPLDGMIEAAGRVESGDYSARVPEDGPPEVRSMARAFNAMSARLEKSDASRRTFLADVSHELRTPLTIIQGQLEAISDGVYPADQEHLAPALEQARAMERLVDDIRTLALSESGGLQLAREPLDLGMLVTESVEAFATQAAEAGVSLRSVAAPGLAMVEADPGRLRSVVANLVSNAIRHTPRGGSATISVARAGDAGIAVEVRDTGSGIPADLLPQVFDRFTRGPGSTGSGLGLAIARDLVEAHGGTITVASEVGRGTTMRFTLPAA